MHAKIRNDRVLLYRSTYVRKGTNGNTHGYAEQHFVGSLPLASEVIPPEVARKLSEDERRYVESKVIEPARRAVEERRLADAARELDPNWRIGEAVRLLREAGERTTTAPGTLDGVHMKALDEVTAALSAAAGSTRSLAAQSDNPLMEALEAVCRAARAVNDGRYGKAPVENVRARGEYQLWGKIKTAVDGDNSASLQRALQDAGFVKARGR